MDIESLEIRDFLLAHPPFDRLGTDSLARLLRHIDLCSLSKESQFPPPDSTEPAAYLVRQGGIELRDSAGRQLGLYGEGDLYFGGCVDSKRGLSFKTLLHEETLLYQIPCRLIDELRAGNGAFDEFFFHSRAERLHAYKDESLPNLLKVRCADLIQRAPVVATPDTTVREAAQIMTTQNVSALLIARDGKIEGIVTDRDLRTRGLAAGIDTGTPLRSLMTMPVQSLSAESTAYEALLAMARWGVHHLPIITHGQTIGMITPTDLFRHQSINSVQLAEAIRRSAATGEVIVLARQLPRLQCQLTASGISGGDLGKAMTVITDVLTIKLLELAEQQFGVPPVPYTWLVFGSQARQEQSAHTDQDNGLLIDDRVKPEHAPYFEALARYVTEMLDQCGIRFCNGEIMASNPRWRLPLAQWQSNFTGWVEHPEPKSLMHASIFFDLRALHGATALAGQLRSHVLALTRGNTLFLAHLTANALHHRPPLGLFHQFVLSKDGGHKDVLDLKLQGIIPVVDLARIYALAAGVPEVNTRQRLMTAAAEPILSREALDNLSDVLELLMTLRFRRQAEQIRLGKAPDNSFSPDQLSPFERGHLKDAFAVIAALQKTLAQRYQSERFG